METDRTGARQGDAAGPGPEAGASDAPGAGDAVESVERACYAALVCPACGAVMGDRHPSEPCGR